ncbi:MAG: hypothetical protein L6V91_01825 [Bacilli bacterium]|nr:MAG: hypothetical protein L6V91_01825 [Bacilli bacterium]
MSGRLVRLVHAHPQKIDKFAGNIDKLERLYELLLPSENTISDKKSRCINIWTYTYALSTKKYIIDL